MADALPSRPEDPPGSCIPFIGPWVRFYRKRAGLSQERLAGLAGVSFATINVIEGGKRVPTTDTLWKIGLALGLDIVDFFRTVGPPSDASPPDLSNYALPPPP
jgi:transcriptional regulator with XRE-family HTH domain